MAMGIFLAPEWWGLGPFFHHRASGVMGDYHHYHFRIHHLLVGLAPSGNLTHLPGNGATQVVERDQGPFFPWAMAMGLLLR